jgi:hypothetical protein
MKKRIMVIAAALALLTLSAASTAEATGLHSVSGSGVLVRHDDGYLIAGTLRDADSNVIGTIHGTLVEQTTGFTSCLFLGFASEACGSIPGIPPYACNLLSGAVTLNLRGTQYDAYVDTDFFARIASSLCEVYANDATTLRMALFMWSESHTLPPEFPDLFELFPASAQQISPNVWKWSS